VTDPAAPTSVLDLAGCPYVLLTTYDREGRARPTPVWAARDGEALVVTTTAQAWKVGRVERRPRITLARCDMRGRPRGAPVDGVAVVVRGPLARRVEAAMVAKYGWQMRLAALVGSLSRTPVERVGIVIRDVAHGEDRAQERGAASGADEGPYR